MTDTGSRTASAQFAADWTNRGDEKQETQSFWISLLQDVLGVEEPTKYIQFELPVKLSHTSFIDGYIPATRVLIEQKGKDIDLRKGYRQSDGSMLTPYQQARRYAGYLPHNANPRWIVVCNFQEFHVHDMNRPNDEPEIVRLADLEREYHRLHFLVDTGDEHIKREMEVSLQAGELVGVLYDALLKQYKEPGDPETLRSLNMLCVRLVFCLYAEDANIFGSRSMFHDYLRDVPANGIRRALVELFRVLDQKPEERDKYLADDNPKLAAFPYVNGGLFSDENIEIPPFTEELKSALLRRASEDFDWSQISPTTPGAAVIDRRIAEPEEAQRAFLGIKEGELLLHIERVRTADGQPVFLENIFLPYQPYRPLLTADLDDVSLFGAIEGVSGQRPAGVARRCLEIVKADAHQAEVLAQPVGEPLFYLDVEFLDAGGRPICMGRQYYIGSRYMFEL